MSLREPGEGLILLDDEMAPILIDDDGGAILLDESGAPDPVPTDVYRLYDGEGTLLYVGISRDVLARLRTHRKEREWFDDVRRIDLSPYPTMFAARDAEREAIATERPKFNAMDHPAPLPVGERGWRQPEAPPTSPLRTLHRWDDRASWKLPLGIAALAQVVAGFALMWPEAIVDVEPDRGFVLTVFNHPAQRA